MTPTLPHAPNLLCDKADKSCGKRSPEANGNLRQIRDLAGRHKDLKRWSSLREDFFGARTIPETQSPVTQGLGSLSEGAWCCWNLTSKGFAKRQVGGGELLNGKGQKVVFHRGQCPVTKQLKTQALKIYFKMVYPFQRFPQMGISHTPLTAYPVFNHAYSQDVLPSVPQGSSDANSLLSL